MTQPKNLSFREQLLAIKNVAMIGFRASPFAVGFKLIGALVDASLPLVITYFAALTTTELANAYNGQEGASDKVVLYILITAGLGFAMTVWSSIDQYIQAKLRYVIDANVSDRMYSHFLSLEFWRYDDKETADVYDRAKRFAQFFAYVFDRIAGVLTQFITMVAGVGALFFVNYWLALMVLVLLLPGIFLQFKLSRTQMRHWNKNVDTRRALNMIEWNMFEPRLVAELRMYGMVTHLLSLRQSLRDKDERVRIEHERKYMPKRLFADGLEAFAEVASLVWITTEIIARAQPVGQFLFVQQVVSRALRGANGFVSQLSGIDEDLANLFDYQQFMSLSGRHEGSVRLEASPERIEFHNVSFHYPTDQSCEVLKGVSLVIKKNQHVAIVGENGAGKSTFLKLLTGLYEPSKGAVLVDGTPLSDIVVESWHKLIGSLQQDFIEYGFATAAENVRFGDVVRLNSSIDPALRDAEARDFIKKLPKGEDSYVMNWMEDAEGNKGKDLSGGQWQRLALARSFFRDAPIIILDEPTSAIDALAEARIFDRLFKNKNKTIITISHRVTTIKKADIIYMFEDGNVVESGSHGELVAMRGRYYRMFQSQLETES
ncbi:ABC transporter ATP-binding protein [Patescibacteria group bacterium]|nr:MAG: ABC transporter ATP-binding protein [Patescibacteria group bacterium]